MATKVSKSLIQTEASDAGKVLLSNGSTLNWVASSDVGVPAGTLITYAGTTVPTGYISCPTAATAVSRNTYAALYAAIGDTWGSGDGVNTFNIPWFTTGFAMVQTVNTASVGTSTTGSVISHSHIQSGQGTGSLNQTPAGGGSAGQSATQTPTQATGGTNNLAAGRSVLFCVKF